MTLFFIVLTLLTVPAMAQSESNNSLPPTSQSIPLQPDGTNQQTDNVSKGGSVLPTIGSIALVAGTLAIILWFLKKTQGDSGRQIPNSVIKIIGKSRIGASPVFLVSIGKKLALVASSSSGLTTLTEINDPVEVETIRKAIEGEKGDDK